MTKPLKYNQESFISEAKNIHGDKYDYSLVKYIKLREKVVIVCSTHGEFEQYPFHHLSGAGCKQCGIEARSGYNSAAYKKSIENWKEILGETFNDLKICRTEMDGKDVFTLTCPKHGTNTFGRQQIKNAGGCPMCNLETKNIIANTPEFQMYLRIVRRLTEKSWREKSGFINHYGLVRSRKGYHLDHEFSIYDGFLNNIPPYIVGHWSNLWVTTAKWNLQKREKSTKSREQLFLHFFWALRKYDNIKVIYYD